jgi:hypothetical protein
VPQEQPAFKAEWIEGDFVMPLEEGKSEIAKVKVRKYNGSVYVDVRKYYDNGSKPTPKGVSLRPDLFSKLVGMKELVEESVDLVEGKIKSLSTQNALRASVMREDGSVKVSIELDRGHQIGVSKFKNMILVDVRSFYNGAPTKKGISLKPEQFRTLVDWSEWKEAVAKLA